MPVPAPPTFDLRLADLGPAQTVPKTDLVKLVGKGRRLRPLGAARDNASAVTPTSVAADEVVRVEYEDGTVLWMRADDLLRERGRKAPGARGQSSADAAWDIDGTAPVAAGTSRGAVGLAIRALEFFGIDLTGLATAKLAEALEDRQLKGLAPGLYRCPLDATQPLQPWPDKLPHDRPVLVFLHGTMSSFRGSFAALEAGADGEAGAAAAAAREALRAQYGEHIYAFEHLHAHRRAPSSNALELARMRLPAQAPSCTWCRTRGAAWWVNCCVWPSATVRDRSAGHRRCWNVLFARRPHAGAAAEPAAAAPTPRKRRPAAASYEAEDLRDLRALLQSSWTP